MVSAFKSLELRHWINLWVFVFSVTVLSAAGHGGQAAIVLLLTGLYVMFAKRSDIDNAPLNSHEKAFVGLVLVFWLVQLVGAFYQPSGYEYETIREKFKALDYPMRWLLLIPVFLLFRRYPLDWRSVAVGISLGAIIAAGIAHYQVHFLDKARAVGASNNPIPFGELMVTVDLILWMFMVYAWDRGNKILSAFLLLASLAAFYGSLLSSSRGALLAYAVMVVIWIFHTLGKSYKNIKYLFSTPVFLRLLLAGLVFWGVSQTDKYKLLETTTSSTVNALSNQSFESIDKIRAQLFSRAIELFEKYPMGIGTDNFAYPEKGHAHNEILNIAVENGLQGVSSLAALILFAMYIFWRNLKTTNELASVYAASGLMLVVSYAIFGQTQAVLSHHDTLIFCVFYLYLFFGQIQLLNRKQEKVFI